jgi:predicted  nucleic acid-binding Zn-ribbon protein
MSDFDDLIEDLKQKRDELRVQMHLASKEVQDEWEDLEEKMNEFAARAELDKTGEGLGEAFSGVGQELMKGYERIRDAIKNA